MIINSAYDTVPCIGFQVKKLIEEIQDVTSGADGFIPYDKYKTDTFESNYSNGIIYCIDALGAQLPSAGKLQSFAHPIQVRDDWYIDLRPFTRIDMRSRESFVTNQMEIEFLIKRAELCQVFLEEAGRNYLRDISPFMVIAYASWISENVSRRFYLDAGAQYRLYIYAGIYYLSQFIADGDIEKVKQQISMRLARSLKVDPKDVFEILDILDEDLLNLNFSRFTNLIERIVGSVRLAPLTGDTGNVALIYSLIGGTWLGYNAREVACVALEHIPTFIAMVYMAANNRGYSNSTFTKLISRKGKNEFNTIPKQVDRIVQTMLSK